MLLNITYGWVGAWSFRRHFNCCPIHAYSIIVSVAILIIQCSAVIVFDLHLVTDTLSFHFCWIVDSQIIRAKCSISQIVRSVPLKFKVYCHYGQTIYVGKICFIYLYNIDFAANIIYIVMYYQCILQDNHILCCLHCDHWYLHTNGYLNNIAKHSRYCLPYYCKPDPQNPDRNDHLLSIR